MKQDPSLTYDELDLEEIEDQYLDEQYESSTELASTFVDDELLPLVEAFDYNNPDPDYVPGCATFGLFARLVGILTDNGFTVEDLKNTVDDFAIVSGADEILH